MNDFNELINPEVIYTSLFDGIKIVGNSLWTFLKSPINETSTIKIPYLIPITIFAVIYLYGNKKLKKN